NSYPKWLRPSRTGNQENWRLGTGGRHGSLYGFSLVGCALAQLAVHVFDGGPDGFRNFFNVMAGHFQLRMPELGLDIPRLSVFLEMRGTRPPEGLVGHVRDARALGERLEIP